VQSELNDIRLTRQVQAIVEKRYDLGKLARVKQIFGGYCNKSYCVWMARGNRTKKFLLREYNPNVTEKEIRFEHALLGHLRQNGFKQAADVIHCRDGSSFAETAPTGQEGGTRVYWALFEFLEGEDKYSWTQTDLTDAEFAGSAEILAKLHSAGHGFVKPDGLDRAQPGIMDFMPAFKDRFSGYAEQAGDRRCDLLFKKHLDQIFSVIDKCLGARDDFQGMLELPIHCDYHPGNLKYRDGKVIGLFDFDYSKVDYRLFDVALGLVFFCSVWYGESAGSLRLNKLRLFLRTYNDTCATISEIYPLTPREQKCHGLMLAAANFYLLNWCLVDFYEAEDRDDEEYYTYIDHNIRLMKWIEKHTSDILTSTQKGNSSLEE